LNYNKQKNQFIFMNESIISLLGMNRILS
jgi:hypothetical protein